MKDNQEEHIFPLPKGAEMLYEIRHGERKYLCYSYKHEESGVKKVDTVIIGCALAEEGQAIPPVASKFILTKYTVPVFTEAEEKHCYEYSRTTSVRSQE